MQYSVALMRIAHQLPIIGWSIFPSIHMVVERYEVLFADVRALLGNNLEERNAVVDKMEYFIGKITRNEPL
jgi:hypothetical protein